jgi:hypothetical protein
MHTPVAGFGMLTVLETEPGTGSLARRQPAPADSPGHPEVNAASTLIGIQTTDA